MATRADIAGGRPVTNVGPAVAVAAVADARHDAFNRFTQAALGRQFQVSVLTRLNDNSFIVRVADTMARMSLPAGTKAGDAMEMTLVGIDPRPTFRLDSQGSNAGVTITAYEDLGGAMPQAAAERDGTAVSGGKAASLATAELAGFKASLADLTKTALGKAALANFWQTPLGKEALAALADTPLGKQAFAVSADPAELAETAAGKAALQAFGETAIGRATLTAIADTAVGKAALQELAAAALPRLDRAAPAPAADQGPAGGTPTSLSRTGRLINEILRSAVEQGASPAIVGRTPLIQVPGAAVPQLTVALKDALVFSGLFYESHVAQWVEGERSVAELMREPQAAFAAADRPVALPGPAGEAQARAPQPASGTADGTLATTLQQGATDLINLQLHTLENNRVLWQGELFPGQPMEWEVSRDAPDRQHDPDTPAWNSSVRFELPTLGAVAANIYLAGQHVRVQVRAASDAAAATLRAHGPDLVSALQAAGTALDQFTVNSDGKA